MIDRFPSRFVETKILSDVVVTHLKNQGVSFATVEDAAEAAMRIISDSSVTGMNGSKLCGVEDGC